MRKKDIVFLAQTDTTAGFLSSSPEVLNLIKSRPSSKPVLIESASLQILKSLVRIPSIHKNRVRKAKQTTFIYPNQKAIRVVTSGLHHQFLRTHQMLFSTSANKTKKSFNIRWAKEQCQVVVLDKRGLHEKEASHIYKINHSKIQRRR